MLLRLLGNLLRRNRAANLRILSFTGKGVVCPYALIEIQKVLVSFGHKLKVIDLVNLEKSRRRRETHLSILTFEPDLIITVDFVGLFTELFFIVPPVKIVSLFFDNPKDFFSPYDITIRLSHYFVFSIDKAFVENHDGNVFYQPWGFDPEYFRNLNLDRPYKLSYIGRYTDLRARTIAKLAEIMPVHVWGDEKWQACSNTNVVFHGKADPRKETPVIYNQSRFVLSFNADQLDNGISERLYNIMACGAVAVTNYVPVLEEHFIDKEDLLIFRDESDLCEIILRVDSQEQLLKKISENGMRKVHEQYTYEKMLNKVLGIVSCINMDKMNDYTVKEKYIAAHKEERSKACEFIGLIAYNEKLFNKANGYFSEAILIDGNRADSYIGKIAALIHLNNEDEALRQHKLLSMVNPNKAKLAENLFVNIESAKYILPSIRQLEQP